MIRLTWLQFRLQAMIAVAALAMLAIALAVTGSHLAHLYNTTVATCTAQGDCDTATNAFLRNDQFLQNMLGPLVLVAPALLGLFWGAPLIAREIQAGTFRLAWTQSLSRRRWLAVKLGSLGLMSIIVAGLLSLIVTWWFSPIDRVNANRFSPAVFDERGIVAIGYAVFAFALGVTAGVLLRRTLPAMAVTLAFFVGSRLAVTYWIRPHFLTPVKQSLTLVWGPGAGLAQGSEGGGFFIIPPTPTLPNAWVYSNAVVDKAGHPPSSQFIQSSCPALTSGSGPTNQQVHSCIATIAAKFDQVVIYQPANRYWTFQWYETALFVFLAFALAGLCFWWVCNRLT
jgi:ABC-type transport system involved in multi-copper enzyme maturation permease subunit